MTNRSVKMHVSNLSDSAANVRVLDPPVSAEQAVRLLQALPVGLVVLDGDGAVRLVDERAAELIGLDGPGRVNAGLTGRHWTEALRLSDPESGNAVEQLSLLGAPVGADDPARCFQLARADGSHRIVEIDRVGHAPGWPAGWHTVLWLRDCSGIFRRLRALQRLSARDHLTNLVNRREFEQRLANALERTRRDGTRHVLLFMDLDRFKLVNDRFGHMAGDAVLKQVAETLRATVRERDTLGRLGGDEFGLLMEACDVEEGGRAATALRQRLRARPFRWQGHELDLDISVGLIGLGPGCTELARVWDQADAACYRDKRRLAAGV
jgi:diguanylate cyclase (GGDEF)-like protein